ncbi:UDP-2,4-diacetamido-2,4,6-trideoxy-beta-L-altropyranose hydrolase [Shewanella algae]|uniref:UDP-2,4-diacetamido-2,4, 6-trideoxy-beta-L-altropyranose hydrolase n=1 Tax=Shewanella algae TaxID=38313 RepID=UPI0016425B16|nr:UDP-2,4-diacetamido-2,4,6-trideoxy-beta-L-altropyranose hydrolase [Shewanella algae]
MSNWFAIRCDATEQIGIGHAMRALAFAEWAKEFGLKPVLFTISCPSLVKQKLSELDGKLVLLADCKSKPDSKYSHSNWLDCSELDDALRSLNSVGVVANEEGCRPKFILVDHYALGEKWERALSKFGSILVFDDLNDRKHECAWLVDQTYGKNEKIYHELGLVDINTHTFIGAKYALLRKEFSNLSKSTDTALRSGKNLKVLISLGGADKDNVTLNVLNVLKRSIYFERLEVTCVTSSSNPNLSLLETEIGGQANFRLLVDAQNMAELMCESDFCIGAPGSTTWERCAVGLPFMSIAIAENQLGILKNLEAEGITISVGDLHSVSVEKIDTFIKKLLDSPEDYFSHMKKMQSMCDGLGANRVISTITKELNV